jgi:hypothetical protein
MSDDKDFVTHEQLLAMNRVEDQLHRDLRKGQDKILKCLQGDMEEGTTGLIGRVEKLESRVLPFPKVLQIIILVLAVLGGVAAACAPLVIQNKEAKPNVEAKK